MQKLIRKLGKESEVRRVAERLLAGEEVPQASWFLRTRLTWTTTEWWRDRVTAAWLLSRLVLTEEERAESAASLRIALQKRETVSVAWGCLGCFTGPFMIIIAPAVILASITDDIRLHRVREAAAEALCELLDPESVGALARAIRDYSGTSASTGSQSVDKAALEALSKTLPMLTSEHYGTLEGSITRDLAWLLARAKEPLAVELLRALEKVGDGGAVRAVTEVAHTTRNRELREEAMRVLPVLEERLRKAKDPEMLLRAASGTDDPSAALLRPAGPTNTSETEQLLRPAASGEDA